MRRPRGRLVSGPEYTRRFATLLQFDVRGNLPLSAQVLSATLHLNREYDNAGGDDADDSPSVFAMETPFTSGDDWFSLGGDSENNAGNLGRRRGHDRAARRAEARGT